jgi:hypothetical protein
MTKKKKSAGKRAAKKGSLRGAGHQRGGAVAEPSEDALPHPQIAVADVETLRALIVAAVAPLFTEWRQEGERRGDTVNAPAPPSPFDATDVARLMATTSEIRERVARQEQALEEVRQSVRLQQEHQQVPAQGLDREGAVRTAGMRWMIANQCRAANLVRPTPAIIGRVMHDERAYAPERAKSPQVLFHAIYSAVIRVFRRPATEREVAPGTGDDHVHLTTEMVELIAGRSSRPQKKHSTYFESQLRPRLQLLVNSGLAKVDTIRQRRRINYLRYLTEPGCEVFSEWPELSDVTGGISAADEPDSPSELPIATEPDASATASEPPPDLPPPPPSPT